MCEYVVVYATCFARGIQGGVPPPVCGAPRGSTHWATATKNCKEVLAGLVLRTAAVIGIRYSYRKACEHLSNAISTRNPCVSPAFDWSIFTAICTYIWARCSYLDSTTCYLYSFHIACSTASFTIEVRSNSSSRVPGWVPCFAAFIGFVFLCSCLKRSTANWLNR